MGNFLIIKKIAKFLRKGTTQGKVDKLENLTRSLTSNTQLVSTKYKELQVVEKDVSQTLENLKAENFEKENVEIDGLSHLEEKERNKFKNSLVEIKQKGIAELEPITESSQRIKAHMLITLNKALIQKAILISKSKLAGNAHLQLDTLKIISKETKCINKDLENLLAELDELNQSAIDSYSSFKDDVKDQIKDSEDVNVVDHIVNKIASVDSK